MDTKTDIIAANYCISFVDLLGQRDEYKGEGFLPIFKNNKDRERFFKKIKKTIKPIYNLQKDASNMMKSAFKHEDFLRGKLPLTLQEAREKMSEVKLKQQRWSDGLVFFVSLQAGDVKCPIGGIFYLFGFVGTLFFLGLCKKRPLRGSIDIAWGVELNPGEIYGAAVATAYELESEIAQYPRIVIGERTVEYLTVEMNSPASGVYNRFNSVLAKLCLDMIDIDFDGNYILDYLGKGFKESITKQIHDKLFHRAFKFVTEQLALWKKKKDTKLSMRYSHLFSYFQAYQKRMEKEKIQPGT